MRRRPASTEDGSGHRGCWAYTRLLRAEIGFRGSGYRDDQGAVLSLRLIRRCP